MSAVDIYIKNVIATLDLAKKYLPVEELLEAERLVDHGEPAEGMCSIAWAISNVGVMVPRELIDRVRAYSSELVEEEFMPPDLDSFAAD
ncbi:hypothetical protein [Nocardioides eburneus]